MSDIKRTSARAVARDYGIRHGLHREVAQELESILESYAEQETAALRKRLAEAERLLRDLSSDIGMARKQITAGKQYQSATMLRNLEKKVSSFLTAAPEVSDE